MITLLSKKDCSACELTEMILRREKIDYIKKKTEDYPELRDYAKEQGALSFPVVFRGDTMLWSGFHLDKLLKLNK